MSQDTTTKTFRIGRRRYAFGLFWQASQSSKSIAVQAKELAKQDGSDIFVVRDGDAAQFALTSKENGGQVGAIAAAACATHIIKGSWIAAVPAGDGWWCLAVRNDYIDPDDGDRYFNTEEEARAHFERMAEQGGWNNHFAPTDWSAHYKEISIEALISAKGPRLDEVNPLAGRLRSIIMLGTTLVLLAGGAVWYIEFNKAHETNEFANDLQNELQNISRPKPVVATPSWYTQPPAARSIMTCSYAMEAFEASAPGWDLVAMHCTGTAMVASWKRRAGSASWLEDWARDHHPSTPLSFGEGYDTATMTMPIPANAGRGVEAITSSIDIWRIFSEARQVTGDDLQLGGPRLPPVPPGTDPKDIKPPEFAPMAFSVKTGMPWGWADHLGRVPGLVLNSITYTPQDASWDIKGDVYVRL